jgi:hypothetical protein
VTERFDIKGGAGEFEAAVIAVVLDHLTREESASQRGPEPDRSLPTWVVGEAEWPAAAQLHALQPLWVRSLNSGEPIK